MKRAALILSALAAILAAAAAPARTATENFVTNKIAEAVAAMKDAGASVKFHALTPEVTDTTVTLKPGDGKANYVDGTVGVNGEVASYYRSSGVLYFDVSYVYDGEEMHDGYSLYYSFDLNNDDFVVNSVEQVSSGDEEYTARCTILKDKTFSVKFSIGGEEVALDFSLAAGSAFKIYGWSWDGYILDAYWDDFCDMKFFYRGLPAGYDASAPDFAVSEGTLESSVKSATLHITLPGSTDHARSFSLSLATDAEKETYVAWEGATNIIETVPGASNLAVGTTVWDVKEVAPGKFRVDRASSPAQSAPLTLTAPNGRVAELAVDDDLVLEVKEK